MKSKTGKNEDKLNKALSPTYSAIRKIRARIRNVRDIKSFFFRLVVLAAFMVLIFYGVFGLYGVKNDEMKPRISAGDLLLFFRFSDGIAADDIVIYRADGASHVGRIVAKEEDLVEVKPEGGLYINGNYKVEKEIYFDTCPYEEYVEYPLTLDKGQYFILADNREAARDSRYYGAISEEQIVGKVISLMRRGKL